MPDELIETTTVDALTTRIPEPDGWVVVAKVFAPGGAVVEAWSRTLTYRIARKELELEEQRLHKQLDAASAELARRHKRALAEMDRVYQEMEREAELKSEALHAMHEETMSTLRLIELTILSDRKLDEFQQRIMEKIVDGLNAKLLAGAQTLSVMLTDKELVAEPRRLEG